MSQRTQKPHADTRVRVLFARANKNINYNNVQGTISLGGIWIAIASNTVFTQETVPARHFGYGTGVTVIWYPHAFWYPWYQITGDMVPHA